MANKPTTNVQLNLQVPQDLVRKLLEGAEIQGKKPTVAPTEKRKRGRPPLPKAVIGVINEEQRKKLLALADGLMKEFGLNKEKGDYNKKRDDLIIKPLLNRLNIGKRFGTKGARTESIEKMLSDRFDVAVQFLQSKDFRDRLAATKKQRDRILTAVKSDWKGIPKLVEVTKVPFVMLKPTLDQLESEGLIRHQRRNERGAPYEYRTA